MYTHNYSFKTDICLHIHSAECTVRLLNQAGRNNYPYNPKYVVEVGYTAQKWGHMLRFPYAKHIWCVLT